MGTEIKEEKPPRKTVVVADSWRTQFFDCKDKGPEPPINAEGFWRKPVHGIPIKEKR